LTAASSQIAHVWVNALNIVRFCCRRKAQRRFLRWVIGNSRERQQVKFAIALPG
jgi:hypothetical protein